MVDNGHILAQSAPFRGFGHEDVSDYLRPGIIVMKEVADVAHDGGIRVVRVIARENGGGRRDCRGRVMDRVGAGQRGDGRWGSCSAARSLVANGSHNR